MKRPDRVASVIKHQISRIVQGELEDSRIGFVTITGVQISADLQHARVYFSVLGSQKDAADSHKILKGAAGFIRKQLAGRIRMRYVPYLDFLLDESQEYGRKIDEVLRKIHNRETRNQRTET